jgi:hypothetical protein
MRPEYLCQADFLLSFRMETGQIQEQLSVSVSET